jgi:hypothetical protein
MFAGRPRHQRRTQKLASPRSGLPDRGEVPDLSVSGDSFDLVGDDPHDPTMTSETRSANAIAEPTPDGYRPCRRKISLITKINSCAQSKIEQESEASNLNITRKLVLNHRGQHIFVCVLLGHLLCFWTFVLQ